MPETHGAFAADLAALFRDPAGVTELGAISRGQDDATLPTRVFLERSARRDEAAPLDAWAGPRPGNLIALARWIGLTAMAGPWLGAVRTWHETQAHARPAGIGEDAEHALFWRLVGGWPVEPDVAAAHLGAWPVPGADPDALAAYARTLCASEHVRSEFGAVAARAAEIGDRIALAQLVLRLTLPGRPCLYPEDATGEPELATGHGPRAPASRLAAGAAAGARARLLDRLGAVTASGPVRPIPAGEEPHDRVCAFARGEELIVAVVVGDRATGATGWQLPAELQGRWRNVLDDAEYELPDRATLAGVLGPTGRAVLTRAG